jgi:hypothetical protein
LAVRSLERRSLGKEFASTHDAASDGEQLLEEVGRVDLTSTIRFISAVQYNKPDTGHMEKVENRGMRMQPYRVNHESIVMEYRHHLCWELI